jgi:hypothetical protein
MNSYFVAQRFIQQLCEPTLILSRKHPPKSIVRPKNFMTMHSLISRIFEHYRSETNRAHLLNLAGYEMYSYVKAALTQALGRKPHDDEVKHFYYQLRLHKNGQNSLKQQPNGAFFLSCYNSILQDGLDWDDSFHSAIWMLENDYVTDIKNFRYRNIILVQPDLLEEPRNKYAKKFFYTLCAWIKRHKDWNIFIADQNSVRVYENGKFIIYKKSSNFR